MTTVYGVTMYGAKLQIQRQLGYKEFPREHILVGSAYLAEKTFQCLSNLFTSARQIQV
jgi:DNA-directed RNA polymerase